ARDRRRAHPRLRRPRRAGGRPADHGLQRRGGQRDRRPAAAAGGGGQPGADVSRGRRRDVTGGPYSGARRRRRRGGGAMTQDELDLEARYRAYLTVLDERRFDDLVHHVHDELTYNDEPLTRQQYADLVAADVAAAPDLLYVPEVLVAAGDQVACRLVFDTAPPGEFLGIAVGGVRVRFAEHVFYRYREGRIAAVRSMIDRAAVAEQVSRSSTDGAAPSAGS